MKTLCAQLDLDFWGHWFYNGGFGEHTNEEIDDSEHMYCMGCEL